MAKKREFKVPSKRQPIFSVVRKILKMTLWRGISVTWSSRGEKRYNGV